MDTGWWDGQAGGMVSLGALANGNVSVANGVSADGLTVVGASFRPRETRSFSQAFRWTADTGMVGLGPQGGALFFGRANAVSGDGSVIVGGRSASPAGSSGNSIAFRWTAGGGAVLLQSTTSTTANAVSADGSVIVGQSNFGASNTLANRALRWTANGVVSDLGFLDIGTSGRKQRSSVANGVSADGSVIVGASFTRNVSAGEAFRWTSGGGMVGLGFLSGDFQSIANAVSGDGSVIVGYGNSVTAPGNQAVLWDANGMRRLQDVLVDDFGLGDSLAGWQLSRATAISADGLHIVGYGKNPSGQNEAFVASLEPAAAAPAAVLEPSSLALLGIGAVCLIGYRRKRRRIDRRA